MLQMDLRSPTANSNRDEVLPRSTTMPTEKAAESALRQSAYRELRSVACHFHEGVLTLRGQVSSYYLSQIAQTLVRRTSGVERVCNRLRVVANRVRS